MKKILMFSGSNSPQSINKTLIKYVAGMVGDQSSHILDLANYPMPLYGPQVEKDEGVPQNAVELYEIIHAYDAFIVSVPEHNGSMPAFLKNTLDWLSRSQNNYKVFADKPMFLLSTSPGPGGAKTALAHAADVFSRLGGNVLYEFSLPDFFKNVVASQIISLNNDPLKDKLRLLLADFLDHLNEQPVEEIA